MAERERKETVAPLPEENPEADLYGARELLVGTLCAAVKKLTAQTLLTALNTVLQKKAQAEKKEKRVSETADEIFRRQAQEDNGIRQWQKKAGGLKIATAVLGSCFVAVLIAFVISLGLFLTRDVRAEAAFVRKNSYTAEYIYESDDGVLCANTDLFIATRSCPETPYREGYRFDGWFNSPDFSESSRFDPDAAPSSKKIVLYGKWVARYTVAFDSNGGGKTESVTVDQGKAIAAPPVPGNTAPLAFDGWYDSASLLVRAEFPYTPSSSGVLYAKWRPLSMVESVTRGMRTVSLDEAGGLWETAAPKEPVRKMTGVSFFSAGEAHVLAVDQNGRLWVWGEGYYGQNGDGSRKTRTEPIRLLAGRRIVSVSAGFRHSLAVDAAGNLWAWGNNGHGQLGDGTNDESLTPKRIESGTFFVSVTAGDFSTTAVDRDGNVWQWGINL